MAGYVITAEQVASISDAELAFGTTKLLPNEEDIPEEFFGDNIHTRLVNAIFYGKPLPAGDVQFNKGFEKDQTVKCIRAHLNSFGPKHEHKMAGVAYMIAMTSTLTEK